MGDAEVADWRNEEALSNQLQSKYFSLWSIALITASEQTKRSYFMRKPSQFPEKIAAKNRTQLTSKISTALLCFTHRHETSENRAVTYCITIFLLIDKVT